jgi:hypothetical protein
MARVVSLTLDETNCMKRSIITSFFKIAYFFDILSALFLDSFFKTPNKRFSVLPGESSDTGVLDGVGLCPGGRKCEGDPLLEPPPVPISKLNSRLNFNCQKKVSFHLSSSPP